MFYIYIKNGGFVASSTEKLDGIVFDEEIIVDEGGNYKIEKGKLKKINDLKELDGTEFYVGFIDYVAIKKIDSDWEKNNLKAHERLLIFKNQEGKQQSLSTDELEE